MELTIGFILIVAIFGAFFSILLLHCFSRVARENKSAFLAMKPDFLKLTDGLLLLLCNAFAALLLAVFSLLNELGGAIDFLGRMKEDWFTRRKQCMK